MSATLSDRELIQQLRNALNHAIRSHFPPRWDNTEPVLGYKSLIAAADARLSQPDWIRVEDALPVVPDGAEFVRVWEWEECCSSPWLSEFHPDYFMSASHWRYAEPTPTPPEMVN